MMFQILTLDGNRYWIDQKRLLTMAIINTGFGA